MKFNWFFVCVALVLIAGSVSAAVAVVTEISFTLSSNVVLNGTAVTLTGKYTTGSSSTSNWTGQIRVNVTNSTVITNVCGSNPIKLNQCTSNHTCTVCNANGTATSNCQNRTAWLLTWTVTPCAAGTNSYATNASLPITSANKYLPSLAEDATAPTTTNNASGAWNNYPIVALNATDTGGSTLAFTTHWINGGAPANTTIFNVAEGNNTIIMSSKDVVGNFEANKTTYAAYDGTPPVSTCDSEGVWHTSAQTITLNATNALSIVTALTHAYNGAAWNNATTFTASTEGNKTIIYWAYDQARNIEANKTCYAALDSVAPATTNNVSGAWRSTDAVVALNGTDASSLVAFTTYWYNGGAGDNDTIFTASTEGNKTLVFASQDNAGNVEINDTHYISIDKAAPVSTCDSEGTWHTSAQTITLNATDAISSVTALTHAYNGAAWNNATTFTASTEGNKSVIFWAYDPATNKEANKTCYAALDSVAPVTTNNVSGVWLGADAVVALNGTDASSLVAFTTHWYNGGAGDNASIFTASTEGNKTLIFSSQDNAGKVETNKTHYISVDKTAPVTTNNVSGSWLNANAVVALNATDSLSGNRFTTHWINSGAPSNATIFTVSTEGNNTMVFYSFDNVGNAETNKTHYISVDKTAPVTTSNASATWVPWSTLSVNGTDTSGSGLSFTTCWVGTGAGSNNTIIAVSAGNNTIVCHSQDAVGNVESNKTFYHAYVSSSNPFSAVWDTSKIGDTSSNDTTIVLPITGTYSVNWGDGHLDSNVDTHVYADPGVYTINISNIAETGFRFNNGGDKLKIINITQWGDLYVGNSGYYFYGCSNLNFIGTDSLNLTGTTDLSAMFYKASAFDGNISNWNTSSVTSMPGVFNEASSFKGDVSNWNTSKVTSMSYMFYGASAFDGNISNWDTGKVTTMQGMFYNAISFNQPLSNWNTSSVTDMQGVFNNASVFNQNISNWDTNKVTAMSYMFISASSFNQPLNDWNTSSVTSFNHMFFSASNFNQDLNDWNTSNAMDMGDMFNSAPNFNGNVSNWDTGKVVGMNYMFQGASNFDQDLGAWNVSSVNNFAAMLAGVNLSPKNYDSLLNGWASRPVQSNMAFDGGNSQYSIAAVIARNTTLIAGNGWTITDGGQVSGEAPAPVTTCDSNGTWTASDQAVALNATDVGGAGLSFTTHWVNDASPSNTTTFSVTTEGNNTITFYSTDVIGTAEANKTCYVALDKSAPTPDWHHVVRRFAVFNGSLYSADPLAAKVYRYGDGTTWTQVGSGFGYASALAVYEGNLYVGGNGVVYRYDGGVTWTSIGGGEGNIVALISYNGTLYAGTSSNGNIYRYDGGTSWTTLSSGASYTFGATVYNGSVLWAQAASSGVVTKMGSGVAAYASEPVERGSFNHLAATYDGSTATIYVNGAAAGTSASSVAIPANNLDLYVGNTHGSTLDGSGGAFKGTIDEVRVWNRSLTADEMKQQYAANLRKAGASSWVLETTQAGLADGNYSYSIYTTNASEGASPVSSGTQFVIVNSS